MTTERASWSQEWSPEWDEALVRLEDFLLGYPIGRALPHLEELASAAGVPIEFLGADERAQKVIVEAIGARPFGTTDSVDRARLRVELMTLEVEVLTERIKQPSTPRNEVRRAKNRLATLRRDLGEIRRLL